MKQFVNPVFQPIEESFNETYRRSEVPNPPQVQNYAPLPQEYDKIFSSQTDMSSRINDSLFQSFDNRLPVYDYQRESQNTNNPLSITQVVDQQRYAHEVIKYSDDDSILNSSFFGAFNTTSDKIQKGFQQMESIYNKLQDVSYQTKMTKTICDEELKAEMRDYVADLAPQNKFTYQQVKPQQIAPILAQPQPIQKEPETKSRFLSSATRQTTTESTGDRDSMAKHSSYLSPQQKQVPTTQSSTQLRHSSFLNQQQIGTQKKPNEIYYSQLVDNQKSQPIIKQDFRNSQQKLNLPSELEAVSRQVSSPQNKQQSQQQLDFKSPPQKSSFTQATRNSQLVNQQKQLFNQAEIKFERTRPQLMKPNWQKKIERSPQKEKSVLQEVLCVICEEYVPFAKADEHCKHCLAKSKQVGGQSQTAKNIIQTLNRKLDSLQNSFSAQSQSLSQKEYEQYLKIKSIIQDIINCSKHYKRLNSYIDQLSKLFQYYQQNFDEKKFIFTLLLQRSLSLAQEKCLKMQFIEENGSANITDSSSFEDQSYLMSELSRLDKQLDFEKNNLETWKKDHEMMRRIEQEDLQNMKYLRAQYQVQQVDNEMLSQINSDWDIGNKNPEIRTQKYTNSVVSDMLYQRDSESQRQILKQSSVNPDISEDMKKDFYKIAVNMKLNLPHNHPGKNILLQDAYEKVLRLKVPKSNWNRFIWEEIQNYRS